MHFKGAMRNELQQLSELQHEDIKVFTVEYQTFFSQVRL